MCGVIVLCTSYKMMYYLLCTETTPRPTSMAPIYSTDTCVRNTRRLLRRRNESADKVKRSAKTTAVAATSWRLLTTRCVPSGVNIVNQSSCVRVFTTTVTDTS